LNELNDPTYSSADTPASRSAQQENDKVNKTHGIYGPSVSEPYAFFDPDTHCLRMCEGTLVSGFPEFSQTLPVSGLMQNGKLYQQQRLVHHTKGTGYSLWPTPTAVTRPMEGNVRMYRAKVQAGEMTEAEAEAILGKSVWEAQGKLPAMWPTPTTQESEHPEAEWNDKGRRVAKNGTTHSMNLADAVQKWPTPRVTGSGEDIALIQERFRNGLKYSYRLEEAVALWPTPTSSEHKYRLRGNSQASKNLNAIHGGKLNPMWVEWLMGFPPGWTDLNA
jgi:hypothetical protein